MCYFIICFTLYTMNANKNAILDQITNDLCHGKYTSDFHLHTNWTDGKQTVTQMHEASIIAGMETILFTEHARADSGDWFQKYSHEVRSLNNKTCLAHVGVEVKVLNKNGEIDISKNIISSVDFVMASVHRFPGEKGTVVDFRDVNLSTAVQTEFELAMSALDNPEVSILGHPFGMCFRRFKIKPDMKYFDELIKKISKTDKAFEINIYYHPEPFALIEKCKKYNAKMVLGSNAHNTNDVGHAKRVLEGKESLWKPFEF